MNWLQFGYQYVAGGIFFIVTLLLCLRKGGADLQTPSDKRALIYLAIGMAGFFTLHLVWILLAST